MGRQSQIQGMEKERPVVMGWSTFAMLRCLPLKRWVIVTFLLTHCLTNFYRLGSSWHPVKKVSIWAVCLPVCWQRGFFFQDFKWAWPSVHACMITAYLSNLRTVMFSPSWAIVSLTTVCTVLLLSLMYGWSKSDIFFLFFVILPCTIIALQIIVQIDEHHGLGSIHVEARHDFSISQ